MSLTMVLDSCGAAATRHSTSASLRLSRDSSRGGQDVRRGDRQRIVETSFSRPMLYAVAGKADDVYHHLFAKVHRLIDPDSTNRRFVTTAIHFAGKPADPLNLMRNPFNFRWGSDKFH
jgi:hypothetical protein